MEETQNNSPKPGATFVHSMGDRSGEEAWPNQLQVEWGRPTEFLTRRGWGSEHEPMPSYTFVGESEWLAAQVTTPTHLVATSWSGVVALEMALCRPDLVLSLVLCEPAVLSMAADSKAVLDHVAKMKPAYEPGITTEEFGHRFARAWGSTDNPETWSKRRRATMKRIQRHEPPWEANIGQTRLRTLGVPILVVTGGSSEMYECIAERMAAVGAVLGTARWTSAPAA